MIKKLASQISTGPDGLQSLEAKIESRTARVGVVGIGYVGLPTMVAVAKRGFEVIGIDVDDARVRRINSGDSYIGDVSSETLAPLVKSGNILATTEYSVVNDLDVVLVCVPTPITKDKEPDLEPMRTAIDRLAPFLRHDQLIVLQSTTFPGTTEEFVLPKLESTQRRVGKDFYLAFALERIDPGNADSALHTVPKVVGGVTPRCTEVAVGFFSTFVDQVLPVSSPKVAEMTKLLENTFRSVNIALVNELAMLSRRMDIDIWEVIDAASTKPFGFMPFYPGPGVGGHCIPVDPFYLSWKAKEYGFDVNFVELAAQTNDNMPYYTVARIEEILVGHGITLHGASLLILGVTFKEDIDDTRNSPAVQVMELLLGKGVNLQYSDPHVPAIEIAGRFMESRAPDHVVLEKQDAVVLLVNHADFNISQIVKESNLLIDTRNAARGLGANQSVVKL